MSTDATEQAGIPAWVNDTPPEHTYVLVMTDGSGGEIQSISLARDEFVYLKQCLALNRGHITQQSTAAAA